MAGQRQITRILGEVQAGDRSAVDKLMPLVYDELRALAERSLRRERPHHTLQATALVHEAYLRLVDQTKVDWQGKTHFLAVSAETIRRILVDHARKRAARKRGGDRTRVRLDEGFAASNERCELDLIALDESLEELSRLNERQAKVVELRSFGGLGAKEIAALLGVSERTIKGDWRLAKAWLRQRLDS